MNNLGGNEYLNSKYNFLNNLQYENMTIKEDYFPPEMQFNLNGVY